MCTPQLALKALFTAMEILTEVWQSPLGDEFRKWYHDQQNPKPELLP